MANSSLGDLLRRGELALDQGQPRVALRLLKRALKQEPNSVTAHFYLALANLKLGLLSDAERHARIVLDREPKEPHAHLNLGVIREKRRDVSSAGRCYLKEMRLNPRSPHAYYNLGRIYFRRKNWKRSLPLLLQSYRLGGRAPFLRDDIAWAAYKSQDLNTERRMYKDALDDNPKDTWALNNLGASYIDTGSVEKAESLLMRAQKWRPGDRMIARNLRRVVRQRAKGRRGQSVNLGKEARHERKARRG